MSAALRAKLISVSSLCINRMAGTLLQRSEGLYGPIGGENKKRKRKLHPALKCFLEWKQIWGRKKTRLWCFCLQSGTLTLPAYYSFGSAEASQQTEAETTEEHLSKSRMSAFWSMWQPALMKCLLALKLNSLGSYQWIYLKTFHIQTRRQWRCSSLYVLNYWTLNRGWHIPPCRDCESFLELALIFLCNPQAGCFLLLLLRVPGEVGGHCLKFLENWALEAKVCRFKSQSRRKLPQWDFMSVTVHPSGAIAATPPPLQAGRQTCWMK